MKVSRFWREMKSRYRLVGTRCGNCGRVYFPPRVVCPACHRDSVGKMEEHPLSGKGTVVSYTVIHDGLPEFRMQIPYIMAIIEMEEGVRCTGQIVDATPDEIGIGTEVEPVFRRIREEGEAGTIQYGHKFRPV